MGYSTYTFYGTSGNKIEKLSSSGEYKWSVSHNNRDVNRVSAKDFGTDLYSTSSDGTLYKSNIKSGNLVWGFNGHTGRINGLSIGNDYVITGSSDKTIRKIDPNGNEILKISTFQYPVMDVGVGVMGNIYGCSSNGDLIKFTPEGGVIWSLKLGRSSIRKIALDVNDNVFTASYDGIVRKINSSGDLLWEFKGHKNSVLSICIDANGYVYSGSAVGEIIKLDQSGYEIWRTAYDTSSIYGVYADVDGYIFVSSSDKNIRKISQSGSLLWTHHIDDRIIYDVVSVIADLAPDSPPTDIQISSTTYETFNKIESVYIEQLFDYQYASNLHDVDSVKIYIESNPSYDGTINKIDNITLKLHSHE